MPTLQSVTVGPADQFGTITCPVQVNAGTDLLMVAAIHIENQADDCTVMTRDGQSLVEHDFIKANAWSRVELWKLVNPNLGLNTLTATVAGAGGDRARLAVYVVEGASQSTPLRAAVKNFGDAGLLSILDVANATSDDLIIDALTIDSTGHSAAKGAFQTQQYNLSNGTSASFEMCGSTQIGLAGTSVQWDWVSSHPWSHIAVAIPTSDVVMQQIRPDADLATTGWATVPLWSKLDEAVAGGDIISGVAS